MINSKINEQAKRFEEKVKSASEQTDNSSLQMLKDMQALGRVLGSRELRRLKNKYGADHPRVRDLQQGLMRVGDSFKNTMATKSDAAIEIPETNAGETLIQGKVKDDTGNAVLGMTVVMQDEAGNELAVDKVRTDASGYFAVKISSEVMEQAKDANWTFSLRRDDGTVIYTNNSAIKLAAERNLLINTVISRDKIRPAAVSEMLRGVVAGKNVSGRKTPPTPVDVASLREKGYVVLGNKRSKEIHDLNNIQKGCQIDEITASNRVLFKLEENAIKKGYDYCAHCYGPEKSRR